MPAKFPVAISGRTSAQLFPIALFPIVPWPKRRRDYSSYVPENVEDAQEEEKADRIAYRARDASGKCNAGLTSVLNTLHDAFAFHTALDLSEGDGRTLIGWTQHNKPNQQFIFTPLGHGGGYLIQNAWNSNYVTVKDGICTGISVVGSEEIDYEKHDITGLTGHCFRIRWPNSRYVVDMEGYGCDKDGTRIQLAYEQYPVHPCQIWRFEEVASSVALLTRDLGHDFTEDLSNSESDSESDWEGSGQDGDNDTDSENDSDDEFHDASEDGLEISLLQVELPNSRDAEHHLGKTTGDVIWKTVGNDSERCKTRLRKTWSTSTTMTTTTVFAASRKDMLEKVLMNHYIVVDCALEQIPFVCVILAGGSQVVVKLESLDLEVELDQRMNAFTAIQRFYGMSWITIEAYSFAPDVNSNNGELNDMQCYWKLSLSTGMGYS
ncbi:hypothetical protein GGU10DRAFT_336664 [Lentinula aff. detonsa]|uniref:Ricin B lectin domain-containing protein n=1 Tax=Lentinula aff. detonsa TaxID=2804958 RepID=A0AA38NBH5_9AGAR|nr:hypothetical protein GGU10DRAFT_336664 [Lentinula aff. detonsa]